MGAEKVCEREWTQGGELARAGKRVCAPEMSGLKGNRNRDGRAEDGCGGNRTRGEGFNGGAVKKCPGVFSRSI